MWQGSLPLLSGLVRYPLKCRTNSWFVTFPPLCKIKFRTASTVTTSGLSIIKGTDFRVSESDCFVLKFEQQ